MYEVKFINSMDEFLDATQIILLLKDQMEYIGSPKTNEQLMKTIQLAFKQENAYLLVISDNSHVIGFAFFNIAIGMESAGKYLWLNEMHIHKNYRSKGYGKILFEEMRKWCEENQVVRIMGMADDSEERTKNFYKQQGAEIYKQDIISFKLKK
ncbi:Acetyltransferase (GNAT) family protein [Candidatus Izimaplasma bacterium HR1]|jgi:GNAT superfamily N-acetyltransferase|uniref:GNAT family N-acetyltransferase n=1 Tax=Candidatus Izimoplasma sp. HR1 TaxID=1541959 RepID=UPI0004F6DA98|nr:Acetyltransferase (GNAT) family protein [Candidatus Izimaplasma bacterium HR1]